MGKGTYIDINTATIAGVSSQATKLGSDIESLQGELRSDQGELSESLTSLEDYVHMCFEKAVPIRRLDTQKETVSNVVSLLVRASDLAEEASRGLVNESEALHLAVDAMTGAASCASVISVVISAINGETDCGDDWVNVGTWIPSPTEIQTYITNRDKEIMKKWKNQSPNERWNGCYKANSSGEVNCSWFAKRKLEALMGHTVSHDDVKKSAGGTITAADGTQYSVNTYSYTTTSELLANIHQPAQNIMLCFHGDTHIMMIDYIADGKVYFSDNDYKRDWVNGYLATGEYPNQCMTLAEFGSWYDKYNGHLKWSYSLTPQ